MEHIISIPLRDHRFSVYDSRLSLRGMSTIGLDLLTHEQCCLLSLFYDLIIIILAKCASTYTNGFLTIQRCLKFCYEAEILKNIMYDSLFDN